jgi:hypothetical protein
MHEIILVANYIMDGKVVMSVLNSGSLVSLNEKYCDSPWLAGGSRHVLSSVGASTASYNDAD